MQPLNFNILAHSFKKVYGSNILDHLFEIYGLEIIIKANEEAPNRPSSGLIQGLLSTLDGVRGTLRTKQMIRILDEASTRVS